MSHALKQSTSSQDVPNTPSFAHSQLIIFDWDGTLFDSTAMISHSLCRAAKELELGDYSKQQAQQVIQAIRLRLHLMNM